MTATIALVDDDRNILTSVSIALQAEGFGVRVYSDPDYFELQKDRVFARSWQWVGDAARVKAPGRVAPLTLLEGCLNEPLVLTSDDD